MDVKYHYIKDKILTIGQKDFDNLTGPVSMHIYEPTTEYLKKFPYAPILILFGDIHRNASGYCQPAMSDKKIYDISCLKYLSELVEKEDNKIDFYIEGGELHMTLDTEKEREPFPMSKLWNLFSDCYTNTTKEGRENILFKNEKTCSLIKNIRWQSGDIRFFKKEKEKFDSRKFFRDIKRIYKNLLEESKSEIDPVKEEERKKYKFKITVRTVLSLLPDGTNVDNINISLLTPDIIKEYITDEKSFINKQLKKINIYMKDGGEYTNELIAKFEKYVDSVVTKAMNKYETNKRIFWKDASEVKASLASITDNIKKLFSVEKFSDEESKVIESIKAHIDSGVINEYIMYVGDIKTILLELYSLARMYKTMIKSMRIPLKERKKENNTDAVHPLIVMFYFGEFHIENMIELLINDYNLSFEVNVNRESERPRCLKFDNGYNLNIKINALKQSRRRYEANIQ